MEGVSGRPRIYHGSWLKPLQSGKTEKSSEEGVFHTYLWLEQPVGPDVRRVSNA